MADSIDDGRSRTREASKQRLRLRRFLFASMFSLVYLVVLGLFYAQDKVDWDTFWEACAIVATSPGAR